MLDNLSVEEAVNAINARFATLFHSEGTHTAANVCLACDRLLSVDNVRWLKRSLLRNRSELFVPPFPQPADVINSYNYDKTGKEDFMSGCLFSPRANFDPVSKSFSFCKACYDALM